MPVSRACSEPLHSARPRPAHLSLASCCVHALANASKNRVSGAISRSFRAVSGLRNRRATSASSRRGRVHGLDIHTYRTPAIPGQQCQSRRMADGTVRRRKRLAAQKQLRCLVAHIADLQLGLGTAQLRCQTGTQRRPSLAARPVTVGGIQTLYQPQLWRTGSPLAGKEAGPDLHQVVPVRRRAGAAGAPSQRVRAGRVSPFITRVSGPSCTSSPTLAL